MDSESEFVNSWRFILNSVSITKKLNSIRSGKQTWRLLCLVQDVVRWIAHFLLKVSYLVLDQVLRLKGHGAYLINTFVSVFNGCVSLI